MLAKKSSVHRCMSGKNSITRGFYPNYITHIPTSKVKWSAPEEDSLRVKNKPHFGVGEHYRKEPCWGVWGDPPPENVQVWRLRNAILSTCHEICLQNINLEYKNGRQFIASHYNQNN